MNNPPILLVYCRDCSRWISRENLHPCPNSSPYHLKRIAQRFTHQQARKP